MQFETQTEKPIIFFGKHRLDEKFGLGKEAVIIGVSINHSDPHEIGIIFKDKPGACVYTKISSYIVGYVKACESDYKVPWDLGYCEINGKLFELEFIKSLVPSITGFGSSFDCQCYLTCYVKPVRKIIKGIEKFLAWDLDDETANSYGSVFGVVEAVENFELQGEDRNTYEAITAAMLGYRVWRAKHPERVVTYDPVRREFIVGNHDMLGPGEFVMSNTDKYLRKYKTDWVIEA